MNQEHIREHIRKGLTIKGHGAAKDLATAMGISRATLSNVLNAHKTTKKHRRVQAHELPLINQFFADIADQLPALDINSGLSDTDYGSSIERASGVSRELELLVYNSEFIRELADTISRIAQHEKLTLSTGEAAVWANQILIDLSYDEQFPEDPIDQPAWLAKKMNTEIRRASARIKILTKQRRGSLAPPPAESDAKT